MRLLLSLLESHGNRGPRIRCPVLLASKAGEVHLGAEAVLLN